MEGGIPGWLSGTLVRDGPGRWDLKGEKDLRHWFDGLAMLHRFSFGDGRVPYANRFLESPQYRRVREMGKIAYSEFSAAGSFAPNDQGLLQPGSQAPSFSIEGTDGGEVSLSSGGGEPTLLVFFATWCPHCNNEAPILSELAQENENLNVVMAGIDGEDNPKKVKQFVEKYDIRGEALYQSSLGQTYQVTGYPTTYVIHGEGRIVGANTGETPRDVLQEWIEKAKV